MVEKEINIQGAGISGLACAIILRKNGYNVNVYEKQKTVGTRFNGDWQGIENWSEDIDVLKQIELYGIDISFEYEPLDSLYCHYGQRKKLLDVRKGVYFVRRGMESGCLDISLLDQARSIGVNVFFNHEYHDSYINVNATGPKKYSGFVKGVKFQTNNLDRYHMAFGDNIAKGAYSYLLVKNGHGTIATVYGTKYLKNSDIYLQNTIDLFSDYVDMKELALGRKFGGYGYFEIKKNLRDENGALLIGEAGGFQDYLWGFGMRYAFQTAYFAARSIMHNESYEMLIDENITSKMRHSLRNRRVFEFLGKLGYPLLYYIFSKSKCPLALLRRVY